MTYKIEYANDQDCLFYKTYNTLPDYKILSIVPLENYLNQICSYSPAFITYHQVYGEDLAKVNPFREHTYAFSLTVFHMSVPYYGEIAFGLSREFKDRCIFFQKCQHDLKETRLGNCWHKHTCTKCGYSCEIDSSG